VFLEIGAPEIGNGRILDVGNDTGAVLGAGQQKLQAKQRAVRHVHQRPGAVEEKLIQRRR